MSCTLSVFACIEDVSRVISLLSEPSGQHGEKDEQKGDWEINDEDWNWETVGGQISASWLQDCCISLSPASDMLALARNGKAVFLASKWDSHADVGPRTKYEVVWSGSLAVDEGECITDLLCVPLASQHRSSQGAPDWTCVVTGFTSGYMRIYLQNGSLLLSQLLHDDPVLRFKCRSWQPHTNYGNAEQVEELAILYPSSLVIIDGFSLYQSLRACRNQLARAQASGSQELIQPPPLAYKKWNFEGQKVITDIASCGVVTPNLFDQLETASFMGGFHASIRGSAPASSHYISTGLEPFVAVYSAVEGSSPSLISDVALAVASKLRTAVLSKLSAASDWLGWGGKQVAQSTDTSKPVKPKVEKGTLLPARFGLPDFRRHGNTITLAPNGKLAVTTDDFGRVMLLDVKTGVVVRLWKGYRDAECGWVMVEEDEPSEQHNSNSGNGKVTVLRTVLFLVIYAAKRGILEVWRTEQGPRVAAFNVGKDCRLLYAGHGIMGLGHVIRQGQAPPQHTLNCLLLQGDGTLKTISVPFHCALSDKHSKRVRDLHLLKKLSALLDKVRLDEDSSEQELDELEKSLQDVLVDLQTPQLQQQGLQCLLSTTTLPSSLLLHAVLTVKETILKRNKSSEDNEDEVEDVQSLLTFCHVQVQLLQTYTTLEGLSVVTSGGEEPWKGKSKELFVAQILGVTKSEAVQLLSSLDKYWQLNRHLTDQRMPKLSVTSFLGCFEGLSVPVNTDNSRTEERTSMSESQPGPSAVSSIRKISVRNGLSATLRLQLASFLFEKSLSGSCPAEKLHLPFDSSGINPAHLMDLLTSLWLSDKQTPSDPVKRMTCVHSILLTISSLSGGLTSESLEPTSRDSNLSPWWEKVRSTLAQSSNVGRALVLANVCRSVAMEIGTANKKVQSEDEEAESQELAAGDWVSVSVEVERWNLLVCQLTDLLALSCFTSSLYTEERVHDTSEQTDALEGFSVLGFLSGGYGAASRVLSRSLVLHNIPPQALGQPRSVTRPVEPDEGLDSVPDEDRPEAENEPVTHPELPGLSELRTRFPHSLQQDILWSHCAFECAAIWDREKEQTDKLMLALDHITCIHCTSLRHGLTVMLWKKYFKEKISAAVMLMEKVGKAPKDRLCRKMVNLSYGALEQFVKAAKLLLEIILETDPMESEVLILEKEDFWQSGEGDGWSLIEEAREQPVSNVPLVELHHKLVLILWIVMGLEMKGVKPLNLFDTSSKAALMKDLSSSASLPSGDVDQAISDARLKFLSRALSFVVTAMSHKQSDPAPRCEDSETSQHVTTTAAEWPPIVFSLAEQFGIDVDCLRRHHVIEMYSAGLDSIANEALLSVHDREALGSQLLSVIGRRLCHVIVDGSESAEQVSRLSRLPPNICSWIKAQDSSKLSCRSVPVSRTVDLLSKLLAFLPEQSSQYNLASGLAETIKFLL